MNGLNYRNDKEQPKSSLISSNTYCTYVTDTCRRRRSLAGRRHPLTDTSSTDAANARLERRNRDEASAQTVVDDIQHKDDERNAPWRHVGLSATEYVESSRMHEAPDEIAAALADEKRVSNQPDTEDEMDMYQPTQQHKPLRALRKKSARLSKRAKSNTNAVAEIAKHELISPVNAADPDSSVDSSNGDDHNNGPLPSATNNEGLHKDALSMQIKSALKEADADYLDELDIQAAIQDEIWFRKMKRQRQLERRQNADTNKGASDVTPEGRASHRAGPNTRCTEHTAPDVRTTNQTAPDVCTTNQTAPDVRTTNPTAPDVRTTQQKPASDVTPEELTSRNVEPDMRPAKRPAPDVCTTSQTMPDRSNESALAVAMIHEMHKSMDPNQRRRAMRQLSDIVGPEVVKQYLMQYQRSRAGEEEANNNAGHATRVRSAGVSGFDSLSDSTASG